MSVRIRLIAHPLWISRMSVSGDAVQSLIEYAALFDGLSYNGEWTIREHHIIEDLIMTGYLVVENGYLKKVN